MDSVREDVGKVFALFLLAILAIALSRNETIGLAIQLLLAAGILIVVLNKEPQILTLLKKLEV